ncbi:MAG: HD-GYP domain-containing protein [Velocimicrobium sp.]
MNIRPDCNFYKNCIDYHEIIECIVGALDAKDPYTAGHSQRVSDMALKVCRLLDFKESDVEEIHIAAHLHDIGKIGVPDSVLNKTDKLNEEEWTAMKKHPQMGADILSKSKYLNELKDIVLYHHERFDGTGYPQGLKGEMIPVGARIIAICDSIDAMTSNRSYRKAYTFEFCYNQIQKNLGSMYDPIIGLYILQHWDEVVDIDKEGIGKIE